MLALTKVLHVLELLHLHVTHLFVLVGGLVESHHLTIHSLLRCQLLSHELKLLLHVGLLLLEEVKVLQLHRVLLLAHLDCLGVLRWHLREQLVWCLAIAPRLHH